MTRGPLISPTQHVADHINVCVSLWRSGKNTVEIAEHIGLMRSDEWAVCRHIEHIKMLSRAASVASLELVRRD